jgi:hypothetical protein
MMNLISNAIAKLNSSVAILNKAEADENVNTLIKIHNEKIAQLSKLLDCKFQNAGIISGNRYYMNDKEQFLTIKDTYYLILGFLTVNFKIYIKNNIIKSVIPCYRNENLTMFARAPKEYDNLKELNEKDLLEFVLNHTSVQFEVIEE